MNRSFFLIFLICAVSIAQQEENKPVRFINDAQTVVDYLSSPAANNSGVAFVDSTSNELWFSDGTSWNSRPFANLKIALFDSVNQVTYFDPGTTQTSRNQALASALSALTDGSSLMVPRSSGVYQIAATVIAEDRVRIDFGGNVIQNIADNQSYLVDMTGDHCLVGNGVVRNLSTTGLGRMIQVSGDDVTVSNVRNDMISENPGTSPFAVFVTSTADAAVLDRVVVSADTTALISITDITGGVRIDGTNALVQNCRFDSVQGHSIQSNSTVPNGSITIRDTSLIYDNARLKNPDGVIGGINMSVLESAGGQWAKVKIENVTYKRIGTYNSPNALSAIKLHRVKSAVLDNVSIDAGTPTNQSIEINIDNDGPDAEGVIDQLVIRNSEIRCPIRTFSNTGIETLTIEDSILDKGLQTTNNNFFLVGGRVGTWKAKGITCEGQAVVSTTAFFRSVTCDRAIFEDIEFNLPSGSPFFLSNGIDLNRVMIRDFNAPNGGTITRRTAASDQQADDLLNAKREGTFDEYVATAGGPPPVLGANSFWSMSDGARAISDNPSVTNDYYYQAGAWLPQAGGSSSDGSVTNVILSGTDLDFTGINGGFNGTVDLSSLGGQSGINTVLSQAEALTAARGINLAGFDLTVTGAGGGFIVSGADDINLNPTTNLRLNTAGTYIIGNGAGGNVPAADGDADIVILGYDPQTGALETTSPAGASADGVVSNVVLSGANLNFTGANGGFSGTVDLSPISASPNPLTYKTSGQQSDINTANTYPNQASIGPAPTVVSNSIYHTIDTATDTINSYYAMDKGGGLQYYPLATSTPTLGLDDVLSQNQALTTIRSIDLDGNALVFDGGGAGNLNFANITNFDINATTRILLNSPSYIFGDGTGGNQPPSDLNGNAIPLGIDPVDGHLERIGTISNEEILLSGPQYAEIYFAGTPSGQPVVAGVPLKFNQFNTNGEVKGSVADHTNDEVKAIANGIYRVSFSASFISANITETVTFKIRKGPDGSELNTHILGSAEVRQNDVTVNCSFSGLVPMNADDMVEVWIESNATGNVTCSSANLTIERVDI